MAHVPLTDLVRDLGEALEAEMDSLVRLARRSTSFTSEGIRLSFELAPTHAAAALDAEAAAALRDQLRAALEALESSAGEKAGLEARLAEAERARAATNTALKRLKARLKHVENAATTQEPANPDPDDAAIASLQADLARERIGRTAAEASLAMLQRENRALEEDLQDSREARRLSDEALAESRQLNADLQSELAEFWRLLRETRPGDSLSIALDLPEDDRRQNVERVQAKIIDARELFKRRRARWPIAI